MENILRNIHTASLNFNFITAFLIFAAYTIVDALFAKYTIEVFQLDEYRSATTGVLTHILLAFGVINYTQNWLYIFPLLIGSWIGTFFMVRRARLTKEKTSLLMKES